MRDSAAGRGLARPGNVLRVVRDGVPIGLQIFSGNMATVEMAGPAGFDFVMLDMEHSCVSCGDVANLIRAADVAGLTSFVRVPDNGPTNVRHVLEAGAHGIVVPRVRDVHDIERICDEAFFPPLGRRGMCPSIRSAEYSIVGWQERYEHQAEELSIIPIIETVEAVDNIDAICAHPQVREICLGPGDLGLAMGHGTQGLRAPEVRVAFEAVVAAAVRHGVDVVAVPYPDTSADACAAVIESGATVLLHSIDQMLLFELLRNTVAATRAQLTRP